MDTLPPDPESAEAKTAWITAFVARVGELMPRIDAEQAWRDGEAIYDAADEMPPGEAADIWVATPPLADTDAEPLIVDDDEIGA
jgi:hypothetical protein